MTKAREMSPDEYAMAVTRDALNSATSNAMQMGVGPFRLGTNIHQIVLHDLLDIDYDSARALTIALMDAIRPDASNTQQREAMARATEAGRTLAAVCERKVNKMAAHLAATPQVQQ